MKENIRSIIQASIDCKIALSENEELISVIERAVEIITKAFQQGNKILFCGNGGSAADAQHLAAEFTGRFYKDRQALPAEALHVNTSYLTSVANDYGFDEVYSRMINGIGKKGDILVALSTSGNSANILNAVKTAKEKEMTVIGFTGQSGGKMKDACDLLLNVSSADTPRIQETHILAGHIICQLVESAYFSDK